ncbi:MAG: OmpW family outer membrane protein [Erythrobacter sp.]|jgi:outer membrane protein|nr:OmpW family outer membrane protein [Erythrobacter sp.]
MKTIKLAAISSAVAVAALAMPAAAQDAGTIQVKLLATTVLPDGSIDEVNVDGIGLVAGSDVEATDSVVPTAAIEYFFSPNFSIETIVGLTWHDVEGTGPLAGAELIDDLVILPATVSAKYHLPLDGVKPYVGAGVAHFFVFGEDVGADAAALGATSVDLSDEFGFVLQAGIDVPLNDGLGLALDAKRYFIGTTATFDANGTTALQTDHDLDPWVLSAGISFQF